MAGDYGIKKYVIWQFAKVRIASGLLAHDGLLPTKSWCYRRAMYFCCRQTLDLPMMKIPPYVLFLLVLAPAACVRPKLYRAELAAHSESEGREKVLQQELTDRKAATAKLTEQVGSLNRTLGNQEARVTQVTAQLTECIQQMGKSASILVSEKVALEKELAAAKVNLAQCNDTLRQIQQPQQQYQQQLKELQSMLATALKEQESAGVVVAVVADGVTLVLPDKILFDSRGLEISTTAKSVLTTLAILLTSRPELDAEVVAYTDNGLPKELKVLKDTWAWSLARATNVVRILIQEYNVNANQLTPVGRGEFYPMTSNETAEGRQQNRRTVIVLHPAMPGSK